LHEDLCVIHELIFLRGRAAMPRKSALAIDSNGRTIWIADAHRGDGKRFVVRADEKLTAFLELESAIPFQKLEAQRSTVAERCV